MTQRRLEAENALHTRFLCKMQSHASAFLPAPAPSPVDSTQTDTVPLPAAAAAFTTPTTSAGRERESCPLYTSWVVQAYMRQGHDRLYNTTMHALNDMLVKWDSLEAEDDDEYCTEKLDEVDRKMSDGFSTASSKWSKVGGQLHKLILDELQQVLSLPQYNKVLGMCRETLHKPGYITQEILKRQHGLKEIDATVTRSVLKSIVASVQEKFAARSMPDCFEVSPGTNNTAQTANASQRLDFADKAGINNTPQTDNASQSLDFADNAGQVASGNSGDLPTRLMVRCQDNVYAEQVTGVYILEPCSHHDKPVYRGEHRGSACTRWWLCFGQNNRWGFCSDLTSTKVKVCSKSAPRDCAHPVQVPKWKVFNDHTQTWESVGGMSCQPCPPEHPGTTSTFSETTTTPLRTGADANIPVQPTNTVSETTSTPLRTGADANIPVEPTNTVRQFTTKKSKVCLGLKRARVSASVQLPPRVQTSDTISGTQVIPGSAVVGTSAVVLGPSRQVQRPAASVCSTAPVAPSLDIDCDDDVDTVVRKLAEYATLKGLDLGYQGPLDAFSCRADQYTPAALRTATVCLDACDSLSISCADALSSDDAPLLLTACFAHVMIHAGKHKNLLSREAYVVAKQDLHALDMYCPVPGLARYCLDLLVSDEGGKWRTAKFRHPTLDTMAFADAMQTYFGSMQEAVGRRGANLLSLGGTPSTNNPGVLHPGSIM